MPETVEKKKLTSTVVMSKSFKEDRDKRDQSKDRRERHYRPRRTSVSDDEAESRRHRRRDRESPDRGGNRERGRVLDRSSHLGRSKDEADRDERRRDRGGRRDAEGERDDGWRGGRRDRDQRWAPRQDQRHSVFDRLDQGPRRNRPMMGRGQTSFRDDRMLEVEVNPQDVPRGKRYFLHDDREMPRRQMNRARSRSPIWSHDMWEEVMQEDEPGEGKETPAATQEEKPDERQEVGEEEEDDGMERGNRRARRVFR